ncbi:Bifunctional ATP-dependent dihydroxyacetone kinase/FAD-AMP lyase (cyclizing) [Trichinella pseudospiralis]|uniref:Triokinase/FMN cyclase n=1 Tax=Trichinella pseudospiralis TaxID=6337 RepID=A0A0V1JJS7_TRIPS|nr:Bifunctional ATP-dependent dihydroxyacetone kinase/FAD-AMP lyase (cyclizing) [Trichinella pseudospiralis]KRY85206.1 Bifunctional ATP-dependent dihydroxyacetone kinase/FAD-AMP lyase (cyclizing) [Trichinella pseudospiralis]KRZ35183.1 Bifunctional ATP-dependent dihydroxyacetone kinase/FAD-AMP lyase (cyclizing) [Trichinella pseudospiralis]
MILFFISVIQKFRNKFLRPRIEFLQDDKHDKSKKLLNSASSCVEDNMQSLCIRNDKVCKLENYPVIIRSDLDTITKKGHVVIISGGGSGHEPAFGGYVGFGMLTAAVIGDIFTSPPSQSILAALHTVRNAAGVVVVVLNYTGDRLHFGVAIERAQRLFPNLPIQFIVMDDDCALSEVDLVKCRRGLAGSLFLLKIIGAMAEAGESLQNISIECDLLKKNLSTIGLGLSSCSPPDRTPMIDIDQNEMHFGIGIHGESGMLRIPLMDAKKTVHVMMQTIFTNGLDIKCDDLSNSKKLFAVMINNLGSVSQLEMNVVTGEVLQWMMTKGIQVVRVYTGTLMTSIDMHGISISLLRIDKEEWINYLDAPTGCHAWPMGTFPSENLDAYILKCPSMDSLQMIDEGNDLTRNAITVDEKESLEYRNLILTICNTMKENEQKLNYLDSECGDGDCGSTLSKAANIVMMAIEENLFWTAAPGKLFSDIALMMEEKVGGTIGALLSIFFNAGSACLMNSTDSLAWFNCFIQGVDAIELYSGTTFGSRTLLDPMKSVADLLSQQLLFSDGSPVVTSDFMKQVIENCEIAVETTTRTRPKTGRACQVPTEILQKPDAGAYAILLVINDIVTWWFQRFSDA